MDAIDLWGGIECTVNRVGDRFFDQIERSGHAARLDDLERFAALGVRVFRTPVLWERTAPDGTPDFRWADTRMDAMRRLGLRPIVGLVHHGSGPAYTSLLDPAFPQKLAAYARAVARQYPDVVHWTPINEPLTTARFSGLYGHWYPHGRDTRTFLRALVQQCRATVLAMRAIREIVPQAWLVQTEDLGRTFSTEHLRYQADYENERRWLSLDLLFGRIGRAHPLWNHLLENGIAEDELMFFREGDPPPNVIGINYYVTSDRYIDERVELFPPHTRGGNTREKYADVEAVRVLRDGIVGHAQALSDVWERFRAPVAITEAHLGCSRDEQLRWLREAWQGANDAKAGGVDVRAVTAWSLLGAHDWNSLLVREGGFYECGAFDTRGEAPRSTAVAHAIEQLARTGSFEHPVLDAPGWWRRPERIEHVIPESPVASSGSSTPAQPASSRRAVRRPILITGGGGGLARAIANACERRALACRLVPRSTLDIYDSTSVGSILADVRPWAVINAAGLVRIPGSAREESRLFRENAHAAAVLAGECAKRGVPLVTFSSEHVFDGTKGAAYLERDALSPVTPFGRSKAHAEQEVLAIHPSALVIRAGQLFGPWSRRDAVRSIFRRLATGRTLYLEEGAVVTPTYAPDLADAALDLLIDAEQGIWHLANVGAVSWVELARETAKIACFDREAVIGVATEKAPANTALSSERGLLLPALGDSLMRYFVHHSFGELQTSVA